jgi:hypothetical protein
MAHTTARRRHRPRAGGAVPGGALGALLLVLIACSADSGVQALRQRYLDTDTDRRLEPGPRFAGGEAAADAGAAAQARVAAVARAEARIVDAIAGTVTFVFSTINTALSLATDVKRARAALMREKFEKEVQSVVHDTQAALRAMSLVYATAVGDVQRQVADVIRDVSLSYVQNMGEESLRKSLGTISALNKPKLAALDAAYQAWVGAAAGSGADDAREAARKALFEALRDDFDRLNKQKFMGDAQFEEGAYMRPGST